VEYVYCLWVVSHQQDGLLVEVESGKRPNQTRSGSMRPVMVVMMKDWIRLGHNSEVSGDGQVSRGSRIVFAGYVGMMADREWCMQVGKYLIGWLDKIICGKASLWRSRNVFVWMDRKRRVWRVVTRSLSSDAPEYCDMSCQSAISRPCPCSWQSTSAIER